MLKQTLTVAVLSLSLSTNAAIIDMDYYTVDTDTGLNWLDVTMTAGLSRDNVNSMLVEGGALEGFRYATASELDQLIINFGYVAVNQNCSHALHCDGMGNSGDPEIIETMIKTLGDTFDKQLDLENNNLDVPEDGAGFTKGILGSQLRSEVGGIYYDTAIIVDGEQVSRSSGASGGDATDNVSTAYGSFRTDQSHWQLGSFLVAEVAVVPVPAAAWLFGSALIGLVGIKRKK